MNDNELQQAIKEYLPSIIHMSAASVGEDGKPWAWEVHYAFDDDLNLYWVSVMGARHSQELVKNTNIAGTIVVQHGPADAPRGVSFEGVVEIIDNVTEDHPAFKAYATRFLERAASILEGYAQEVSNPVARRIFKVNVTDYYLVAFVDGKLTKNHLKRS